MRQKNRQVKFYCSEEDYQRLQSEKAKTGLPVQDLLTEALRLLLQDIEWRIEIDHESEQWKRRRDGVIDRLPEELHLKHGERHWVDMWLNFIRELPEQTVTAEKQVIQDFLRFFRSSRLKAGARSDVQTDSQD
jgi:hypothetical protein